ncbi:TRAP transporter small permease subunit [Pseudoruegeria sp. HB172150]|uniref:TRAP transporter small permease subunit n=1 Tax=Pseudoruegeria sp. HB172150 TaxID=2721164 RepID=UPI001557EDAC|nr:TRAP transporter small permease [Pseudoruegeria sp. HB172150]
MEHDSVWLGPLRGPVRWAMIGCSALTLLLCSYLILGQILGYSDAGMYEMIRPKNKPLITATLIALTLSLLLTSIYLSDRRGSIEIEPTGPFDILSLICGRLAMIGILLTVLVMFYEVVARYIFEKPTLWANELSLWIAGFIFLLAGLYAMQQRSHIRIYVIYDIMPRWMQKLADCLTVLFIWIFTICMIWGGYNEARDKIFRMETFGTAWDPPLPSTMKVGILVIISLVSIQALSNLIADWNKEPDHHSPLDEIDETEIENIKATLGEEPKNG